MFVDRRLIDRKTFSQLFHEAGFRSGLTDGSLWFVFDIDWCLWMIRRERLVYHRVWQWRYVTFTHSHLLRDFLVYDTSILRPSFRGERFLWKNKLRPTVVEHLFSTDTMPLAVRIIVHLFVVCFDPFRHGERSVNCAT